jgi:hypothetical protein
MSPSSPTPAHARLGVRLLGLFFLLQGFWQLSTNLLASFPEFDPNYLGFYFRSQMLGPLVGMGLGLLLWGLGGWLSRRLLGPSQP